MIQPAAGCHKVLHADGWVVELCCCTDQDSGTAEPVIYLGMQWWLAHLHVHPPADKKHVLSKPTSEGKKSLHKWAGFATSFCVCSHILSSHGFRFLSHRVSAEVIYCMRESIYKSYLCSCRSHLAHSFYKSNHDVIVVIVLTIELTCEFNFKGCTEIF